MKLSYPILIDPTPCHRIIHAQAELAIDKGPVVRLNRIKRTMEIFSFLDELFIQQTQKNAITDGKESK